MSVNDRAAFLKWARQARRLWLFLDYDGTLADFAPNPEHLEPDLAVIGLLEQLVRRPAFRVTVLSGRRLEHIRRLLPVAGIFVAGTYGIELLEPTGKVVRRAALRDIRPGLEAVRPQWEQLIRGRTGFFLEDKGWALALHARFADQRDAEQILARAREMVGARRSAGPFRVLGGHQFLELAPRLASKREAVAFLLKRYALPDARLLYIGDDDKDEEAFPVIHAGHGVAVKVRQPSQAALPTSADFCLQSPADTLRWLRELL